MPSHPGIGRPGSRGCTWCARACSERSPGPARSATTCGCAGSFLFPTAFRRESSARGSPTTPSWEPSSARTEGVQTHSRCGGRHRGVGAGAAGSHRPGADQRAEIDIVHVVDLTPYGTPEVGVPVSVYEEACRAQGRLVLGNGPADAPHGG